MLPERIRPFLQRTLGFLIVAYALLLFALDNTRVQQFVGTQIEAQLEDLLHSDVQIGSVKIGLLNSVTLHDVLLKDRQGKDLLKSQLLSAKLQIAPLLDGRIVLRNIALIDTHIRLYKTTAGARPNFQYILDAFKGEEGGSQRLDLRINSLILRRCTLSYDEWYRPRPTPMRFSPHHIALNNIDASISLKALTSDSLNLRVRHLAAHEASGVQLRDLRLHIAANRTKATIKDFLLLTPHSRIAQQHLTAHYDASSPSRIANTLTLQGQLRDARLATRDALPFLPQLGQIQQVLHLNADYVLRPQLLTLSHLDLQSQTDALTLKGDFVINWRGGELQKVQASLADFRLRPHLAAQTYTALTQKPYPAVAQKLGELQLRGKGHYSSTGHLLWDGAASSALGQLNAHLSYQDHKVKGRVASTDLNASLLTDNEWVPSKANFELAGEVNLLPHQQPNGQLRLHLTEAILQGRKIQHLQAEGQLSAGQARLHLTTDDANARLALNASAQLNAQWHPSQIQLSTQVQHFVPSAWGLTSRWGLGAFAFEAQAHLPQLSLRQPMGELLLRNLVLRNDGATPYHLERLHLLATPRGEHTHLHLRSDFADLDLSGPLSSQAVQSTLRNHLHQLSQQLHEPSTAQPVPSSTSPQFSFALHCKRTDFLQRIMGIDLTATQPIELEGALATNGQHARLNLSAPNWKVGSFELQETSLALRNEEGKLNLLAKGRKSGKKGDLALEVVAHTENGKLYTDLQWRDVVSNFFYGKIETRTTLQLPSQGKRWSFNTDILPTTFTLYNNTWNVHPSHIHLDNGQLNIANFTLAHSDQMLSLTGAYAKNSEGIKLLLRQVDVNIINLLTGLEVVTFKGRATGRGLFRPDAQGNPSVSAQLDIPRFYFNDTYLGHAKIEGGFGGSDQTIDLDAHIVDGEQGHTNVEGYVSLGRKRLDLQVEGENTPIAFLNHYITDIFEDIRGQATGRCRVFGPFKAIDFEGRERASASLRVPITGVTYHAHNADIVVEPGSFQLLHAQLTDSLQGQGQVQGVLRHKHLNDMTYDFSISGQRIKLYDRPYEIDMPFYSTAFGSGDVRITGHPGLLNANISVVTEPGSTLTYILDQPDEADQQLLSFHNPEKRDSLLTTQSGKLLQKQSRPESKTDIRLNMEVDVRPSSTLRMITDIKSGDVITVHGGGPIQANYYNKGDFQMFGTYTVQRGAYDLSIQNIIKKTFTLLPGGTVNFAGNPLDADVDVHASYMVNSASLADLNIGAGFANHTTPVNCLIDFSGKVSNMQLTLDFDLPNVGEDEKSMVRQLIASDEDRTMQVLYLLGVGRFFTYNYAATQNSAQQSQSEVMMKSLLASTLSSQLTNILSNALGTSNWSLGANVATGQLGWNDMEVDGLLSGRLLGNRLLINGKVGYHERETATTNFVGDFDVHYLLTPTGNVSLKAYSETNDRYFSKSTLTTQGVGLQLKRDFTSFLDLFRRKRKPQQQPK